MKLFARLFYILFGVFVIGIVAVCLVDPTSVWSRIAAGLVTGSFVGLVNTLTNYFHARQEFFEKMALSLLNVEFNLGEDYIHAKTRNSFIADMSKKQMIKYAAENEHLEDTIAKSEKMHKRYQELASKFDFEAYVPLIPWTRKKTMKVLETMDELISSELVHLYGDYRFCFDFTLLSSPASKEEQQMVIGDPDEFYDHVVQENKDYQDLIAFNLNSLADLTESLSPRMKGVVSKMHMEILSRMPFSIRDVYLRDAVIRDVRSERAAEVEKEWEGEADDTDESGDVDSSSPPESKIN